MFLENKSILMSLVINMTANSTQWLQIFSSAYLSLVIVDFLEHGWSILISSFFKARVFHCNSDSISLTQVLDLHPVSNNFRLFSPPRSLFPVYPVRKLTGLISYPYLLWEYWGTCLFVAWWLGLEAGGETGSASFPGIRFPTPSLAWIYSFGTWNPGQPGGCVLEAAAASICFITAGFW